MRGERDYALKSNKFKRLHEQWVNRLTLCNAWHFKRSTASTFCGSGVLAPEGGYGGDAQSPVASRRIEIGRRQPPQRIDGNAHRTEPPVMNQRGGEVAAGFQLTLSAAQGVIHFTTDGTDPRTSASRRTYTGPLTLQDLTTSIQRPIS